MTPKTCSPLTLSAVAGLAVMVSAGAVVAQSGAQPARGVNITGATLQQNFFNARAQANDFIDVDGNLVAGALGNGAPTLFSASPTVANNFSGYWAVNYRGIGSINGYIELLNFGRTFAQNPADIFTNPVDFAYLNGVSQTQLRYINTSVTATGANVGNPGASPFRTTIDGNYTVLFTASPTPSTTPAIIEVGGHQADIASVDVPSAWVLQGASGTAVFNALPTTIGYGQNPRIASNPNGTATFPAVANTLPTLPTGIRLPQAGFPNDQDTLVDTRTAFVPVAAMVNYGVGRTQVLQSDLRHMFSTGRALNGENLAIVTRDVGSGTRNAFINPLGLDPSWGVGENVGTVNNTANANLMGPGFLPSNKGGSGALETTVRNVRLAIGHTGAERGAGSDWLRVDRAELLAVKFDLLSPAGTQFFRPSVNNVILNSSSDSYRIGGIAIVATLGDPYAAPAADGGRDWPQFNWDRDTRPLRPLPIDNPAANDPADPSFNNFKDAVRPDSEPAFLAGSQAPRNAFATRYVNNISRSATAFTRLPGADANVFSPGEFLADNFFLPNALQAVPADNNPLVWIQQTPVAPLVTFTQTDNITSQPRFATFNLTGTSQWPQRQALTVPNRYSHGLSDANTYRRQTGSTVGGTGAASLRNKISGDFNGDGLRNINDTNNLLRAWQDRQNRTADGLSSTTPWTAPDGTGLTQAQGGIFGTLGADAVIEVLGDFTNDGNFGRIWNTTTSAFAADFSDVRYFADGLAIDPDTNNLNRLAGFTAVDNQWSSITAGADNNFFNVVLATELTAPSFVYAVGSAAADVAGSTGRVTRGYNPIGADGIVNAFDIDYVCRQFNQAGISGSADWANTAEAVLFDLSADINGDLKVDQADVDQIVITFLQTSYGDVNLDGFVTIADRNIINANLNTAGGWARGDMNCDGLVNAADLAVLDLNRCFVDFNGDGFLNQEDLAGFIATFLDESIPAGPSGTNTFPCPGAPAPYDTLGYAADYNVDCNFDQEDLSGFISEYFLQTENPTTCIAG